MTHASLFSGIGIKMTVKDQQAIEKAKASNWTEIDEGWAETEAGREEVHRIKMRMYHREERIAGML